MVVYSSAKYFLFLIIPAMLFSLVPSSSLAHPPPVNPLAKTFPTSSMQAYKKEFPASLKVWSPSVKHHMLTLKYACPPRGDNVSPAVSWSGIPKGSTRLHLVLEDGFCTWGCDVRGKADHWILDFPVSAMKKGSVLSPTGISEGAANSKVIERYTSFANASGKRNYFGPCSPAGQPHAWVFQLTAYRYKKGEKVILGKAQSVPFLFPKSELIAKK